MLRAFSRRLKEVAFSRSVKTTTGIVGLPVDPNARENLTKNLLKIKELMTQMLPESAYYRTRTLEDVEEKLKILNENENDEAVEEIFGFQLEQVISMTEDEINLVPFLVGTSTATSTASSFPLETKPWEAPAGYQEITYDGHDPNETGFWEGPPGVVPKGEGEPQSSSS